MPSKPSRTGEYIETENGNKVSRRAQLHSTPNVVLAGKTVIQQDVVIRGDLVRQQQQQQQQQPKQTPSTSKAADDDSSAKPTSSSSSSQQQQHTVSIHLGRYVFVSSGCTLHPPSRLSTITSSTPATAAVDKTSLQSSSSTSADTAPSASSSSKPDTQNQTQNLTYHPLRVSSHVYLGPNTYIQSASIGSHVYIGRDCVIGNMVIIKDCVRIQDGTVLPAGSVWRSGIVVAGKPGRVVGEVGEGWVDGGLSNGAGQAGTGMVGGMMSIGTGYGAGGMESWTRELWASIGNDKARVK